MPTCDPHTCVHTPTLIHIMNTLTYFKIKTWLPTWWTFLTRSHSEYWPKVNIRGFSSKPSHLVALQPLHFSSLNWGFSDVKWIYESMYLTQWEFRKIQTQEYYQAYKEGGEIPAPVSSSTSSLPPCLNSSHNLCSHALIILDITHHILYPFPPTPSSFAEHSFQRWRVFLELSNWVLHSLVKVQYAGNDLDTQFPPGSCPVALWEVVYS